MRNQLPRFALPKNFDGSTDRCRDYLRQCDNFFAQQPEVYGSKTTWCAFMLLLLTGKALDWASAVWDSDPQVKTLANYFANLLIEFFEYPAGGKDISVQLLELRQGSDTVVDFAIKFRTLAAQLGWNEPALIAVFREGLNTDLKVEMASCKMNACPSTSLRPSISIISDASIDLQLRRIISCLAI